MTPDEYCASCRFYSGHFECRRHAPIARRRTDLPGQYEHAFPRVQPMDWCGDYDRQVERT